jgi:chromate transport protein ChrA
MLNAALVVIVPGMVAVDVAALIAWLRRGISGRGY